MVKPCSLSRPKDSFLPQCLSHVTVPMQLLWRIGVEPAQAGGEYETRTTCCAHALSSQHASCSTYSKEVSRKLYIAAFPWVFYNTRTRQ